MPGARQAQGLSLASVGTAHPGQSSKNSGQERIDKSEEGPLDPAIPTEPGEDREIKFLAVCRAAAVDQFSEFSSREFFFIKSHTRSQF